MFTVVFNNCAKSLSNTIFAEGYLIEVPVSLPVDVVQHYWEGQDLVMEIKHPNKKSELAWEHTLTYLFELLEPEEIQIEGETLQ